LELAASSVVQLITAEVLPGLLVTDEITGGVLSTVNETTDDVAYRLELFLATAKSVFTSLEVAVESHVRPKGDDVSSDPICTPFT